jgi:hypothetical protein
MRRHTLQRSTRRRASSGQIPVASLLGQAPPHARQARAAHTAVRQVSPPPLVPSDWPMWPDGGVLLPEGSQHALRTETSRRIATATLVVVAGLAGVTGLAFGGDGLGASTPPDGIPRLTPPTPGDPLGQPSLRPTLRPSTARSATPGRTAGRPTDRSHHAGDPGRNGAQGAAAQPAGARATAGPNNVIPAVVPQQNRPTSNKPTSNKPTPSKPTPTAPPTSAAPATGTPTTKPPTSNAPASAVPVVQPKVPSTPRANGGIHPSGLVSGSLTGVTDLR